MITKQQLVDELESIKKKIAEHQQEITALRDGALRVEGALAYIADQEQHSEQTKTEPQSSQETQDEVLP
jgi:cell division protein FtsB